MWHGAGGGLVLGAEGSFTLLSSAQWPSAMLGSPVLEPLHILLGPVHITSLKEVGFTLAGSGSKKESSEVESEDIKLFYDLSWVISMAFCLVHCAVHV